MYNKNNVLFCFLLITNVICLGQNRKVEMEIIGEKSYDSFYIRSHDINNGLLKFSGEAINDSIWIFTIPDSIVVKSVFFDFIGLEHNIKENRISFLDITKGDTLTGRYINFEFDELRIHLKVQYHKTVHEKNEQYIQQLKKTVLLQQWDCDYFFIDPNQNKYLQESMIDPTFGFFQSKKDYKDVLTEYSYKIKEDPNSIFYITRLAMTPKFYSIKNMSMLYNLFSNNIQNSYFGQIVKKNFTLFKMNNVELLNYISKREENIVENPNKYTLLIFSSSWCAPCIEKIPLMRKIYDEMNKGLDMVYITIDDEKTIPQWEKLMQRKKIPWRSLWLNNKDLKDDWNIIGIPDYILINIKMEAQKISLNNENDIKNLYSMIQHN